jgi:hypothetical protein
MLLIAALALGASACYQAPFVQLPARRAAPVEQKPLALDEVELLPLYVLPTFNDTPSPAFSPSGRKVAFRALLSENDGSAQHAIQIIDLAVGEESSALVVDSSVNNDPYYYDEYGYYGGGYYGGGYYGGYGDYYDPYSQPVVAFQASVMDLYAPALLDDERGMSGSATPYSTRVVRYSLTGARQSSIEVEGHKPRPNPQGTSLLVQRDGSVAEYSLSGELIRTVPGYEPLWSPRGERFVVLMSSPQYVSLPSWDEDFALPPRMGEGLVLVQGKTLTQLSEEGFSPSWHPDGEQLAFECITEDDEHELRLIDVRTLEQRRLGSQMGSPSFHRSGQFLSVMRDGEVFLLSLDGELRALGIEGREAHFSPDGRHLMLLRDSKRQGELDLAFYRLVLP